MMKKTIAIIIALSVALTLSACGNAKEKRPTVISATASDMRPEADMPQHPDKPQSTDEPSKPEEEVPKATPTTADTEVQKLWNGWYYGGVDMRDCTDVWAAINGKTYDAMMRVVVDENGEGQFQIMDPHGDLMTDIYVDVKCMADKNAIYAVSGTAFNDEINAEEWVLTNDNGTIKVSSSSKSYNGSNIGYDYQFRRWGDKWEGIAYANSIPKFNAYIKLLDQNFDIEQSYLMNYQK